MNDLLHLRREMQHFRSISTAKLRTLYRSICFSLFHLQRTIFLHTNSFLLQVLYFVSLSWIGYWILKGLPSRTQDSFNPRSLDLLFTSVSAVTVSSMSTVEIEVFSNTQLIVIMILMFIGGEAFNSMVGLQLKSSRIKMLLKIEDKVASIESDPTIRSMDLPIETIELGLTEKSMSYGPEDFMYLKYLATRFLGFVVLCYIVTIQLIGVAMVSIYLKVVSRTRDVLRDKGLNMMTFSFFTVISTFVSCGFVPTNENMMVFAKDSTLLLILIPQVLLGNTLFPSCLRFCLWIFHKFMGKAEASYLLRNTSSIGCLHLLPSLHSQFLVPTVFGLIGVQFVAFCAMKWNSEVLAGLGTYQKVVGVLFQCVNTRHTGETIVDLSNIAPAVSVLFILMMYLPPYTSFMPANKNSERYPHTNQENRPKIRGNIIESLIFSQLSYLAIFIIMICITEREKMKDDPLNFSVLNVVFEVISAYGNVGFSMGYSCERQLKPEAGCTDKWFGFSGKWSDQGKIILMIVMVFGRLKKFNMNGGRGWKLL